MSNPCTGISGNPFAGKKCVPGYVVGMLVSETKPTALSEATAQLLATYEALFTADKPDRVYPVMFDISEPSDVSITEETLSNGSTIKTNEVKPSDVYKIIATECGLNTIYAEFQSGKEVYCAFLLSANNIEFKKGLTAGTVEFVKCYVTSSYSDAKPGETSKVILHVQPWEKYKGAVKYIGDLDFEVTGLTGVQSMNFTSANTASTTTLSVDVTDCSGADVTGLATGAGNNFLIHNVTDNSAVTVTGATRTGNTYALTYASQTAGDVLKVYYDSPSNTDEKYELTLANALSVTIPT